MLKGLWHPSKRKRTLWSIAAALTVLVIVVTGVIFIRQYSQLKDPKAKAEATSKRIVEKVGNLYLLPEKEKPTVAQIEDKSKLAEQGFFDSAKNGDYLLVYTDAKIALLYREGDNKLVNVGPINTGQNSDVAGDNTEQGN